MDLIKEIVLEKLAKQTPPQKDSFSQSIQEDGVTYEHEYIKDGVDRYTITQESSSGEKTYTYVVGDYDQVGSYWEKLRCRWQRESRWDTETQSWKTEPTKITVTNWIEYPNRTKEDVTSKTWEGNIMLDNGVEERFGILWNFYLCRGEREFLERKKAGWTPEKMKESMDLQRKVEEIKRKQAYHKYSSEWKALCVACQLLIQNGQKGKDAAKELIRIYRINHRY